MEMMVENFSIELMSSQKTACPDSAKEQGTASSETVPLIFLSGLKTKTFDPDLSSGQRYPSSKVHLRPNIFADRMTCRSNGYARNGFSTAGRANNQR